MRAGRAIRWEATLKRDFEQPCPGCGHPTGQHRELQGTYEMVAGVPTLVPHPDYRTLHFHCGHGGCTCVQVAA